MELTHKRSYRKDSTYCPIAELLNENSITDFTLDKEKISRGIIAGLVATAALSAIMMMKTMMGVMPAFNIIGDWTNALAFFDLSIGPAVAWILHFALGAVWGVLYVLFHRQLSGGYVVSGIIAGVLAWLGMMIGFMPVSGNGLFALGISPMVTMATLVLHILFGAVLGYTYSKLAGREQVASDTKEGCIKGMY